MHVCGPELLQPRDHVVFLVLLCLLPEAEHGLVHRLFSGRLLGSMTADRLKLMSTSAFVVATTVTVVGSQTARTYIASCLKHIGGWSPNAETAQGSGVIFTKYRY
jgi:hypothetical protein